MFKKVLLILGTLAFLQPSVVGANSKDGLFPSSGSVTSQTGQDAPCPPAEAAQVNQAQAQTKSKSGQSMVEKPAPLASEQQIHAVWKNTVPRPYAYKYASGMPPDPASRLPLFISKPSPARKSSTPAKAAAPAVKAAEQAPPANQNINPGSPKNLPALPAPMVSSSNGQANALRTAVNSNQGATTAAIPANESVASPAINNGGNGGTLGQTQLTNVRPTSLLDTAPLPANPSPRAPAPYAGPAPSIP